MKDRLIEELAGNLLDFFPLYIKKLVRNDLIEGDEVLAPSHHRLLSALVEEKKLAVSDIASILTVSPPNVTPLVRRLKDLGLVERIHDESDLRRVMIALTEKGRAFTESRRKAVVAFLSSQLSCLDEPELERFARAIGVVRDTLAKIPKAGEYRSGNPEGR